MVICISPFIGHKEDIVGCCAQKRVIVGFVQTPFLVGGYLWCKVNMEDKSQRLKLRSGICGKGSVLLPELRGDILDVQVKSLCSLLQDDLYHV